MQREQEPERESIMVAQVLVVQVLGLEQVEQEREPGLVELAQVLVPKEERELGLVERVLVELAQAQVLAPKEELELERVLAQQVPG